MTVQDHCHLWVTADSWNHESSARHVIMPGNDSRMQTAAQPERGLTGVLHVHAATATGTGDVLHFDDFTCIALCQSKTERDNLRALSGKLCTFIPYDHLDGVSHAATGGWSVLPLVESDKHLDSAMTYWQVQVRVMENTLT